MKPTASFKISNQYTRTAASILCSHERGAYLRAMVSAQLEEESARRQPLNKKDKQ